MTVAIMDLVYDCKKPFAPFTRTLSAALKGSKVGSAVDLRDFQFQKEAVRVEMAQ